MTIWRQTFFFLALLLAAVTARVQAAMTMDMSNGSHGRYLGKPDLALTSAMVAAGGGARHFDARRLSAMLTAQHHGAEFAHLDNEFGRARVDRYFQTFDVFISGALAAVKAEHVRLPHANPALAHDPYVLAASLRAAGVMPDGRFDVGYFIEHLISRPVHKRVMTIANGSPAIGPAVNADFHVILTSEMDDLKSLYHLPR